MDNVVAILPIRLSFKLWPLKEISDICFDSSLCEWTWTDSNSNDLVIKYISPKSILLLDKSSGIFFSLYPMILIFKSTLFSAWLVKDNVKYPSLFVIVPELESLIKIFTFLLWFL